jgi:hypothetical protein
MSMFDQTTERAFTVTRIEPDEGAVTALLKPPALPYLRELRRTIDQDPIYLTFHDKSVGLRVQSLLNRQGIVWNDDTFDRQFMGVVMEAITRLRTNER